MWKKHQQQKKRSSSIKLALLSLGILIGILLLGKVLTLAASFNKPVSNLNTQRGYSWDGKSAFNIVFYPSTSILSYHPKEDKVVILHISDNTYLETAKSYGSWVLSSIYPLGQSESPPRGEELLKLSLSKLTGLHIDGVLITKEKNDLEDLISKLHRKNLLEVGKFLSQSKTDLTMSELSKLFWSLSQIRSDKVISLNLERSEITQSKLLPDSTRVLGVDNVKLDLFIRENMADSLIVDEAVSVAIFNATSHPGLAQDASRIVTNMGANIVQLSNTENLQASSVVILKNDKSISRSLTYQRLTQIFATFCLKKKCQSDDLRVESSRANINIVLGEDYYKKWYER